MEHLIEFSHAPNVDFGVIEWQTPVEVFQNTAFHLYDETAVVLGTRGGTAIITDHARLADYHGLFDELAASRRSATRARMPYSGSATTIVVFSAAPVPARLDLAGESPERA